MSDLAQRWYELQLANVEATGQPVRREEAAAALNMTRADVDNARRHCIELSLITPRPELGRGFFDINVMTVSTHSCYPTKRLEGHVGPVKKYWLGWPWGRVFEPRYRADLDAAKGMVRNQGFEVTAVKTGWRVLGKGQAETFSGDELIEQFGPRSLRFNDVGGGDCANGSLGNDTS